MAAKGTVAKATVIQKIQEIFGSDFAGQDDKKIYIWVKEGNERVQVALALTIPKTPFGDTASPTKPDHDWGFAQKAAPLVRPAEVAPWEDSPAPTQESNLNPDISAKEQENLATLLERLGL